MLPQQRAINYLIADLWRARPRVSESETSAPFELASWCTPMRVRGDSLRRRPAARPQRTDVGGSAARGAAEVRERQVVAATAHNRCRTKRRPELIVPASVQSSWLRRVVEAAFAGLVSQSSFAIGIGATCMFAHQFAPLPCRCSSRWCLRQSGTVNSSLTFLPNDRGWAILRWCASHGLA